MCILESKDVFTESRQKDKMHVILGRLSFVSLGVTFAKKLSQRPTLEKATYLSLPVFRVTKREDSSLSSIHWPQNPCRAPMSVFMLLLRGRASNALMQNPGTSLVVQWVKNPPAMQETWVRFLGRETPLEKKYGNPLQYCLANPIDRGAWWATVHGVEKSWTQLKWLSTHTHTHTHKQNLSLKDMSPALLTPKPGLPITLSLLPAPLSLQEASGSYFSAWQKPESEKKQPCLP